MAAGFDMNHKCAIFGVWDHEDAARYTYLGLYGQQHRGQESCGITTTNGLEMFTRKGMGLVAQYFDEEKIRGLVGHSAIGHVRYSTAGTSSVPNAQPIYFNTHRGPIAIAHNGNLVNADAIYRQLQEAGTIFMTTSDTEVIIHLIAQSSAESMTEAIINALLQVKGAFSLTILTKDALIAVRDPWGFRPLVMGRLDGQVVFASESTAFDLIGAEFIDELEPGEMRVVSDRGVESMMPFPETDVHQCIFEHVYFARPDSHIFNSLVHTVRSRLGEQLAIETAGKLDVDVVVPVPDGGNYIALGYSRGSGIPFEMALVRNHYVGRTFIEPEQGIRDFGVKVKLNPIREFISGKRIGLVDDSIVRGTTSRKIAEMMRNAGAREVHYLIGSPPYISPCYYGIDTPRKEKLLAANVAVKDIPDHIGADSVHYLSLEGLKSCVKPDEDRYCTSCFTGKYPVATTDDDSGGLHKWSRRVLNGGDE